MITPHTRRYQGITHLNLLFSQLTPEIKFLNIVRCLQNTYVDVDRIPTTVLKEILYHKLTCCSLNQSFTEVWNVYLK